MPSGHGPALTGACGARAGPAHHVGLAAGAAESGHVRVRGLPDRAARALPARQQPHPGAGAARGCPKLPAPARLERRARSAPLPQASLQRWRRDAGQGQRGVTATQRLGLQQGKPAHAPCAAACRAAPSMRWGRARPRSWAAPDPAVTLTLTLAARRGQVEEVLQLRQGECWRACGLQVFPESATPLEGVAGSALDVTLVLERCARGPRPRRARARGLQLLSLRERCMGWVARTRSSGRSQACMRCPSAHCRARRARLARARAQAASPRAPSGRDGSRRGAPRRAGAPRRRPGCSSGPGTRAARAARRCCTTGSAACWSACSRRAPAPTWPRAPSWMPRTRVCGAWSALSAGRARASQSRCAAPGCGWGLVGFWPPDLGCTRRTRACGAWAARSAARARASPSRCARQWARLQSDVCVFPTGRRPPSTRFWQCDTLVPA